MKLDVRLKKLESQNPTACPYSTWLKSLTLDELVDARARQEVTTELRQSLDSDIPANHSALARLDESWHPSANPQTFAGYAEWTDAELVAEVAAVRQRLGREYDKKPALKAKWRTYYLTGALPDKTISETDDGNH